MLILDSSLQNPPATLMLMIWRQINLDIVLSGKNPKSGLRQLIVMVLPGYNHDLRMFEVATSYPDAFPIICSQASIHFQSFLVFPWPSAAHPMGVPSGWSSGQFQGSKG
jgi:hypothetical protein